MLTSLHWLPIKFRMEFKILLLAHKERNRLPVLVKEAGTTFKIKLKTFLLRNTIVDLNNRVPGPVVTVRVIEKIKPRLEQAHLNHWSHLSHAATGYVVVSATCWVIIYSNHKYIELLVLQQKIPPHIIADDIWICFTQPFGDFSMETIQKGKTLGR